MIRRIFGFLLQVWGAASLLALLLGAGLLFCAGWWLRAEDEPKHADALVILAGDPRRAAHAADLYLRGLAPVIYLGRPLHDPPEPLCSLGLPCPRQEDQMLAVLAAKGVPPEAVRMYGRDLLSTVEEGESLARELAPDQQTLLVVTSPWHSRRAKIILKQLLPGRELVMSSTPHERFETKWWTHQPSARAVVTETAKFLLYFLGEPFRSSSPPPGP